MSLLVLLPVLAAAAAQPQSDEEQFFTKSAAVCTALVLNPQGYGEQDLQRLAANIADREGYQKDMMGLYGRRFNRNGLAALYYSYSNGQCSVGVGREILAHPDVQGIVDKTAKALNLTFDHKVASRWASPRIVISYSPPSASDIDGIASVTFERPK
ncbi:MAG: hypothetical protein JSR45_02785 [Proteobacteria bacterium]|nr:hypothetical protein [Pseudomonadota bacterium]